MNDVATVTKLVEEYPPNEYGYTLTVQAYAAMTGHPVEPARLDRDLTQLLPKTLRTARSARDLPPEVIEEIWRRFRAALEPLRVAGKLGYVLLQMPKWFPPNRESRAYLERAAGRLAPLPVAVEFRQAGWMAEARRARVLEFLRATGLVYVSVDEPQDTPASVPPRRRRMGSRSSASTAASKRPGPGPG